MGSAIRARQGFELDAGVGGSSRNAGNGDYPMSDGELSGAGDGSDGGSTERAEYESEMVGYVSDDQSVSGSEIAERSSLGHTNTFGPWDAFRRDLPKVVALRLQEWKSFDRKRIRRQRKRIGRADWASNIPCEEPKGKRLKLPLMGISSTVYPDYAGILAAQLGDASFGPAASAGETNSVPANTTINQAPGPACVAVDPDIGESADAPPLKRRRKKAKSSKKTRTDRSMDGDEGEAAGSPLELRDDDGNDDGRECIHVEDSAGLAGGGTHESGGMTRQIIGEGLTALEISRLTLLDQFAALARADAEVAACKNALVVGYEAVLRKATLDLEEAREKIRIKEAELETVNKERLDRVKDLDIARNRISQLEKEKIEDSEKTKRAMERMRQSRNRELLSERNCVVAAADRRFESFEGIWPIEIRRRRSVYSMARLLELWMRKEADGVIVEVITERDLALSPPRSASVVAPRSPYLGSVAFTTAQTSAVAHSSATVVPGNHTNASDRPFGTVSGPFGTVSGPPNRDDPTGEQGARVLGPEETGTAHTGDSSLPDPLIEA
ncbi:hypothetical protein Bca4012_064684 [Brassica carinata]